MHEPLTVDRPNCGACGHSALGHELDGYCEGAPCLDCMIDACLEYPDMRYIDSMCTGYKRLDGRGAVGDTESDT